MEYYRTQNFAGRLAILIGCDILLALVDSFIPHELTTIRAMVAFVELIFMTVTMALATSRVLEDY
jgi:hypothetical protein